MNRFFFYCNVQLNKSGLQIISETHFPPTTLRPSDKLIFTHSVHQSGISRASVGQHTHAIPLTHTLITTASHLGSLPQASRWEARSDRRARAFIRPLLTKHRSRTAPRGCIQTEGITRVS